MAVYKDPKPTGDGRCWYFKFGYKDLLGNNKQYRSKRYLTKKEAVDAERVYIVSMNNKFDAPNMSFKDLYSAFRSFKSDKVKKTTLYDYNNKERYISNLFNIQVKDFNIQHFEQWKRELNKTSLSTTYKNDIYKFLKSILNYGSAWYNYNFNSVYNKMTNFTNPNERKKEMLFYTYDEFQKFISYETDIKWKTLFETLYYCGLRKGELKALTWNDIFFDKKVLSVNKQITMLNCRSKFEFSSTKTQSSVRVVPLTKVLLNDLKMLYEVNKKNQYGFNNDYFVFSDAYPISDTFIYSRRSKIADDAGLKHIRIHDFRHSCASLLINNGANITLVAKFLGHTKIEETLNTYSHMYSSALDSVISIIDSIEDN